MVAGAQDGSALLLGAAGCWVLVLLLLLGVQFPPPGASDCCHCGGDLGSLRCRRRRAGVRAAGDGDGEGEGMCKGVA